MASRRLAALERLIEQWAAVGEGAGLQDSMGLAVCVAAMSFGIRHRVQHRGVAAVPHSADSATFSCIECCQVTLPVIGDILSTTVCDRWNRVGYH